MPTPKETPKIYQLKVTLRGVKPPVWRRFLVASDERMDNFHIILQVIMGWCGGHLYSFNIDGNEYGEPHPEYAEEMLDAGRLRLRQALGIVGEKFSYTYDFGDDWEHNILLEKILDPEPGVGYPMCVTGKRNCPPEDCGGPWGYANMLRALNDPEDPEHEEMVEWMDSEFDPEEFDCEWINKRLPRKVLVKKAGTRKV